MSQSTPPDDQSPDPQVGTTRKLALNEDWAATIVGLALLLLLISGVVSPDVVPG